MRRYVYYIQEVVEGGGYFTPRLGMSQLSVFRCPKLLRKDGCSLWFTIEEDGVELYSSAGRGDAKGSEKGVIHMTPDQASVTFEIENTEVAGDVRVTLFEKDVGRGKDSMVCYFWFHTGFVEGDTTVMRKPHIDLAWSDRACKTFEDDFAVHITWSNGGVERNATNALSASFDPEGESSRSWFGASPQEVGGISDGSPTVSSPVASPTSTQRAPGILGRVPSGGLVKLKSLRNRERSSWRRVDPPGFRVLKSAKRFRGLDQDEDVGRTVRLNTTSSMGADDGLGPDPIPDNLCCHDGPPVSHQEVRMYAYQGGAVHAHKFSKENSYLGVSPPGPAALFISSHAFSFSRVFVPPSTADA